MHAKLACLLTVALLATPRPAVAQEKGPRELQGQWKLVSVETGGNASAMTAQPRWLVKGDKVLYGGDDVSSETWDHRNWDSHTSVRDRLFSLAVEACLSFRTYAKEPEKGTDDKLKG